MSEKTQQPDSEWMPMHIKVIESKLRRIESELSASQAREAELLEKLEAAEAQRDGAIEQYLESQKAWRAAEALNSLQAQSIGMLSKELEAVEARIKESQEQEADFVDFEVYGYASDNARNESWRKEKDWSRSEFLNIIGEDWAQNDKIRNVVFHHYSAPIIPPELAELQRQVEFWKSSSQEWKLAYVAIGGTASESGKAELRKLLESKVPEGWQLVPKMPTAEMLVVMANWEDGHASKLTAYQELIAAAPTQPKEPKQ